MRDERKKENASPKSPLLFRYLGGLFDCTGAASCRVASRLVPRLWAVWARVLIIDRSRRSAARFASIRISVISGDDYVAIPNAYEVFVPRESDAPTSISTMRICAFR